MFSGVDSGRRGTITISALESICKKELGLDMMHIKAIVKHFGDGKRCDYFPFVRIVETHGEPFSIGEITPRLRAAALALRRRAASSNDDVISGLRDTVGGAFASLSAENKGGQTVIPASAVMRTLSTTFGFPMTTAELCFLCVHTASQRKKARAQLEKEKAKMERLDLFCALLFSAYFNP